MFCEYWQSNFNIHRKDERLKVSNLVWADKNKAGGYPAINFLHGYKNQGDIVSVQ